jgi:DNA-directed RNA polymerase alpha subunit
LARSGITTMVKLRALSLRDIANLPGMGVRSLAEVEKLLESRR